MVACVPPFLSLLRLSLLLSLAGCSQCGAAVEETAARSRPLSAVTRLNGACALRGSPCERVLKRNNMVPFMQSTSTTEITRLDWLDSLNVCSLFKCFTFFNVHIYGVPMSFFIMLSTF